MAQGVMSELTVVVQLFAAVCKKISLTTEKTFANSFNLSSGHLQMAATVINQF